MKYKERCDSILKWLAVCLAGLLVAGCAATRENEALEKALATYAQAESRPEVVSNAPLALREAGETLRQAEQADEEEEATHLAYLAERKAEIVIAMAEREEARKEAASLGQQKQQLLLQARETEAERARREAEARGIKSVARNITRSSPSAGPRPWPKPFRARAFRRGRCSPPATASSTPSPATTTPAAASRTGGSKWSS